MPPGRPPPPSARLRAYRRVRRWVDHDLGKPGRPVSPVVMVLPMMIVPILQSLGAGLNVSWAIALLAAALLAGFLGWRAIRLLRAGAIRGDRDYDRRGRFILSGDYRVTQSATRARQMERVRARR